MTRRLISGLALAAAAATTTATAWAGTNVGVSIGINQPGVYGRIDIGRVPAAPPVYIYSEPVVIVPTPYAMQQRPIYLHVPPGHARDWRRHCGHYNACGQPVYFVQENWYQQHYARAPGRDAGRHHGRGPGREWREHDRGGRDGRDGRDGHDGREHGHGRGHDRDRR